MSDEYVPSPGEVLEQQRDEIEAAKTKDEAYEAIDPVLAVCAMHDQIPEYEALPPGGGLVEQLAMELPLGVDEIHARLEHHKYELHRMEDSADFETTTTVYEQGEVTVVVEELEFDNGDVVREVSICHRSESGELKRQYTLSEEEAHDLHALLGELVGDPRDD